MAIPPRNTLVRYQKAIRPVQPASFPQFVDTELERVGLTTANLVRAISDLEARLTAAGL